MEKGSSTILASAARINGSDQDNRSAWNVRLAAACGVLGALGVFSSCCLLPLMLLSLGVSGIWIGNAIALAPYQPLFVSIAVTFLGYGYYCVYWRSKKACGLGEACDQPRPNRLAKLALWIATALFVTGAVFDYIEPLLPGS